MSVLTEARDWLEKMKAHTDCCGTPIVRKLVAEIEILNLRAEMAEDLINDNAPQTAIAALHGEA